MKKGKGTTRVLIATGLYPPDIGGPATYTALLERALPERGFEVSVCSFGAVRHLPKIIRHFSYFRHVVTKGRDVDIIYAQDPVSVGLPAALAARFLNKRFIVKVVGDYAWEQYVQTKRTDLTPDAFQAKNFGPMTELRRWIERAVARRAEAVVVPSRYLQKIVGQWGVNESKIHVVYNSFRPPETERSKKVLRTLLKFDGQLIVSAGRLVPWKGFDTLIELAPRFVKHFPDTRLFIVGDGPDRSRLEARIAELNLGDRVVCMGSLDHEVLLRYIEAADAFVLNTAYEGFSHLLLEAAALGTPVVTTDAGGNPELFNNGTDALLVPYNDKKALEKAVLKVLRDEPYADKLARSAKQRAHDFGEENMLVQLTTLFNGGKRNRKN